MIVDAQIHAWERPLPGRTAHRPGPFLGGDVIQLMDEGGVGRAVLVPPSWAADGNRPTLEAAQQHPERLAVMGRLWNLDRAQSGELAGWLSQPGMLGIRLTFNTDDLKRQLLDGVADWVWRHGEQAGIPIMVYAPSEIQQVAEIAARHPQLRLVVDHLGLPSPPVDKTEIKNHITALKKLARLGNVAVKVSALPLYSTQAYPFADIHGAVQEIVEAFGPARAFWGSDATRLSGPYRETVGMMDELLQGYGTAEKDLVMGKGLCDWLRWE